MILQALVQLAENERLIADPDFEFRSVAWIVRLREDGTVLGIEDNRINLNEGKTDKRGKPVKAKWVGRDVLIPLFPTGRSGIKPKAAFLVDMAKFVFGQEPLAETNDGSLLPYVERFRQIIADCETATNDPSVAAVRTMLDNVLAGRIAVTLPPETGPSDLFMFRVGTDHTPVHARASVQAYWKQCRAAPAGSSEDVEQTTCLVTGAPIIGKPVLFPLIKGVPGAGTMGSALLPFNGPSSRTWSSYGFEGNENAPVSRLAAEAAAMALNRLADARPTNGCGEPLPVRRIRLSDDTIVVFWSPEPSTEVQSVLDTIPDLLDPREDSADVGNLIASYRTGSFHPLKDPARFYALTLTGTTGRVIVRDWLEETVAAVQLNLRRHFDDLACVRNTPRANGRPPRAVLTLSELMNSLAAPGRERRIPAALAAEFSRAALRGTPYPLGIIQRALLRQRAEIGGDDWDDYVRRDARVSLVKAVLNRARRADPGAAARYPEVQTTMDPDSKSIGYQLGTLLAIIERLQTEALEDVNASVVDKYFAAASATPRVVFDRLLRNARHHARKGSDKNPQMIFVLERLLDEIVSHVDPSAGGFPTSLDLEQQGLFIIGYHHMRKFLWMNREERDAWEAEHPNAPRPYLRKRAESAEAVTA